MICFASSPAIEELKKKIYKTCWYEEPIPTNSRIVMLYSSELVYFLQNKASISLINRFIKHLKKTFIIAIF